MTDYARMLSDLESLSSEVDYDMVEYDQAKIDALAKASIDMAKAVELIFGAKHFEVSAIISNAQHIADTDRDEWEGNHL